MTRLYHLAAVCAAICLTACAALFDAVAYATKTFAFDLVLMLDRVAPFHELAAADAMAGAHLRPTREVTYLSTGMHRMAQNLLRIGPNDDDEDGDNPDDGDDDDDAGDIRRC